MIDYSLSLSEKFLMPVFSVYSIRHFQQLGQNRPTNWLGHLVLCIAESIPLLGALVSLIESSILRTKVNIYFAYGSNMSKKRLEERVGQVELVGPAVLKGYRFLYNKIGKDGSGKANVTRMKSSEVHGITFKLSNAQLKRLDKFEGAPRHYKRQVVQVVTPENNALEVITYIAYYPISSNPIRPNQEYWRHIQNGAIENGLDPTLFSFKQAS